MTLQVDNAIMTRGGSWNFTGRLFDDDSIGNPGLEEREISKTLDGEIVGSITTSIDGTFSYTQDLGYEVARGPHIVEFSFSGETFYLPTKYNLTVYSRADIEVEIFSINLYIIRGDPTAPIKIQVRIMEIGGDSKV